MPERIQRKRTRGWRMPLGAIYVGRPGKWGNPYTAQDCGTIEAALALYEEKVVEYIGLEEIRRELRGKDLACWCKIGSPCHADILLKLANGGTP
ncbi:MAG: DUF4326 domain-containing protein [Patescibacteria group bacterium]|nr:DUF4326 domain-containing protein [Patescibacteria group bacterium]